MGEHDEHIAFEMGYDKGFKDGIKGSIPKADYENRLKADLKAILVELQLEIEENGIVDFEETYVDDGECIISVSECNRLIQEKINALKGDADET